MRVLIIEDEPKTAAYLRKGLGENGFIADVAANGDDGLHLALTQHFDLIVLDAMLPGRDGFSIVSALRQSGCYTPVLMLTARGRSEDIVTGFAAGADDYLPKPFDLGVLMARLSALLRRMHWHKAIPATAPAPTPGTGITLAGHIINLDTLEIRPLHPQSPAAKTIHLTLMEAELLRYLLDHPGKVISRSELLENVWHVREDTDTRAIDNFIVRLRRYLEPNPAKPIHLLTIRAVGYRFLPEP